VYEEMLANMNGEMERLKNNENKLNNQVGSSRWTDVLKPGSHE